MATTSDVRQKLKKIAIWLLVIGCVEMALGAVVHMRIKAIQAAKNRPPSIWRTLSPGQSIELDLGKMTAPVYVQGVYLQTTFPDKARQPPGAHVSLDLDGMTIEDTPGAVIHPQHAGPLGHMTIYPGGLGTYRVWENATP